MMQNETQHVMQNEDPSETQHFSDMAEEWWDPKGSCKPLHALNPVRLQFITDRVDVVGKDILDIGCGAGILTEGLAMRKALVTGIDASEKLIEIAKAHCQNSGLSSSSSIRYLCSTAEEFSEIQSTHSEAYTQSISSWDEASTKLSSAAYKLVCEQRNESITKSQLERRRVYASKFDIITCLELLEHVPDPESLIMTCRKLIKPGGDLFFSTLNRTPKSYLMAILGAEYLLKLLPKNTHHYEKFIRPSELEEVLRKAGFLLHDIAGLHYNPFFNEGRLTQDVSVNYIMHVRSEV